MADDLLFVYGTLRDGSPHPRAWALRRESELLGRAWMRGRLYRVAHYPGLRPGGGRVTGELLRLAHPESTLRWLDAYEGAAFRRERRPATLEDGQVVTPWRHLYIGPTAGLATIPGGHFLAGTGGPR